MTRLLQFSILLYVLSTGTITQAAQSQTNQPLRLSIDLVDGSHIIGVPGISSIPAQTSYAKMNIPLQQIASITIDADHETASFDLHNDDKLKSVLIFESLELKTIFGKVKIDSEHMKQIYVIQGNELTDRIKEGLVLYYSFDKDEGNIVTDKSPNKNHGTGHGTKWTPKGKAGGARDFDGQDDWIGVEYVESLAPTREVSFAAWVFRDDWAGYTKAAKILSKTERGGWQIGLNGTTYGSDSIGAALFRKDAYGIVKTDRTALSRGWHHLAGTSNGRLLHFYVDGKLAGTDDAGSDCNITYNYKNAFILGAEPGGGSSPADDSFFNGRIDEVMIFNRVLSKNEIKKIYNTQK